MTKEEYLANKKAQDKKDIIVDAAKNIGVAQTEIDRLESEIKRDPKNPANPALLTEIENQKNYITNQKQRVGTVFTPAYNEFWGDRYDKETLEAFKNKPLAKPFSQSLYHGSSSKFDTFKVGKSESGEAVFLTPQATSAEEYGDYIYEIDGIDTPHE